MGRDSSVHRRRAAGDERLELAHHLKRFRPSLAPHVRLAVGLEQRAAVAQEQVDDLVRWGEDRRRRGGGGGLVVVVVRCRGRSERTKQALNEKVSQGSLAIGKWPAPIGWTAGPQLCPPAGHQLPSFPT